MKKNGFTLIELIISIALFSLIGISIGITLNKSFKKNQNNEYDEFINKVVSSANTYASSDTNIINLLETNKGFIDIKASDLINSGILSTDLVNPNTGSKITGEEIIRITLDDNGTLKFEFNPGTAEEYLIARSIIIKAKSGIKASCFNGDNEFNTSSLMHVLSDGNNANDLTSNTIKCTNADEISKIDTTKIGNYEIKLSYKTINGVWKSAIRKILVVDAFPPTINITLKDSNNKTYIQNATTLNFINANWTNSSETINVSFADYESGLKSYAFDLCNNASPAYTNFSKTGISNETITSTYKTKTDLCVFAKDVSGNSIKKEFKIDNIDTTKPTVLLPSTANLGYTDSQVLNIKLADEEGGSGISGYLITNIQQSNLSSSSFNSINGIGCTVGSKSCSFDYKFTANGYYYVYVIDRAQNMRIDNTQSIHITNIAIKRTINKPLSGSTSDLRESYPVNNLKSIISVTTDNGYVSNYKSGNYIVVNAYNGSGSSSTSYASSTCPVSSGDIDTQDAVWENGEPDCSINPFSTESGGICYIKYSAQSIRTARPTTCTAEGYYGGGTSSDYDYLSNTYVIYCCDAEDSFTNASLSWNNLGDCVGSFPATGGGGGYYSCRNSNYTLDGSTCIYCYDGSYSESAGTCVKNCTIPVTTTTYTYNLTISYYEGA
jgi:prepilin-type N-terminal cleavage/methylation domain-containing protein